MIVPSKLYNLFETQHSFDISRRKLYKYLELDLLGDNDSSDEMSDINKEFGFKLQISNNKIEIIEKSLSKKFLENDKAFETFLKNKLKKYDETDYDTDATFYDYDTDATAGLGGKRRNTTRKRRRRVTRRKGPIIPKKKKKKRHTRKGKR